MKLTSKQFVRYFLLLMLLLTLPMALLSLAVDPFWIGQKQPYWLVANHGRNVNLDTRMRLAKSLQIFTRPMDMVMIGSSKVTRGFNDDAYNMGIDALSVIELEQFVTHLERWRAPSTLVIGLDYAMFDAQIQREEGDAPEMLKPGYAPEALLATLFSRDALDAVRGALGSAQRGEGRWHWNGYQEVWPSTAEKNQKLAESIAADNAADLPADATIYGALERSIVVAQARGTRVLVYFSPIHRSIRERMITADAWPKVGGWKTQVQTIAMIHGVRVYDFTEAAFTNDMALLRSGSTDYWYDPSHFTPKAGDWMLQQMR